MFIALKVKSDMDPDMENLDVRVLHVSNNLEEAKKAIEVNVERNKHLIAKLQWLDETSYARDRPNTVSAFTPEGNWRMVYFVTDPTQFDADKENITWSAYDRWEIQEWLPIGVI